MITLVDNYDSFTFNLAQYLGTNIEVSIVRNDDPDIVEIIEKSEGVIFSPGPGEPKDAGRMEEMIAQFYQEKPMLGICLGHQAMAEVFGGTIERANAIRHGKTSEIQRTNVVTPLFSSLEETFPVMRYHSLVLSQDSLPTDFEVTSYATDDQEIMSIQHKKYPVYGLQFHPESIGTPDGQQIIRNFLNIV